MNRQPTNEKTFVQYRTKFLLPGNIIVSRSPMLISTVLGSCVAVCLWDQKLRYGGMNHFMMDSWHGDNLPTARYGDLAINKLIDQMINMGSNRLDLRAKVFGGAGIIEAGRNYNIGAKNILLAITLLKSQDIRIIAENTGGYYGRNIKFYSDNGEVLMKFIQNYAI